MKRPVVTLAIVWFLAAAFTMLLGAGERLIGVDSTALGIGLPAATWNALESGTWIRDGRDDAPRVVYAFTDPNCPYCRKFWKDARPWVDAGKVQIRHVMVGMLGPTSAPKAAALLSAPDPAAAFLEYERDPGRLALPTAIDEAIRRKLDANFALMQKLGSSGTPTIVFRDAAGGVREVRGAPRAEALLAILGPR